MNFKEEISLLEKSNTKEVILLETGTIPVILTAVHTMEQLRENGSLKFREPYTKAIARYVAKKLNGHCLIKIKDTKVDSNSLQIDEFKTKLETYIKEHSIRLLIDLHGAASHREFDVEFGTLNNLSADFSTIKELEEAFIEHGVLKVQHNNPFKGGGITQYIYSKTDIDIIQIEIHHNYRDISRPENIEKICESLISFIQMYCNFIG